MGMLLIILRIAIVIGVASTRTTFCRTLGLTTIIFGSIPCGMTSAGLQAHMTVHMGGWTPHTQLAQGAQNQKCVPMVFRWKGPLRIIMIILFLMEMMMMIIIVCVCRSRNHSNKDGRYQLLQRRARRRFVGIGHGRQIDMIQYSNRL
jgi:hypothetical protein